MDNHQRRKVNQTFGQFSYKPLHDYSTVYVVKIDVSVNYRLSSEVNKPVHINSYPPVIVFPIQYIFVLLILYRN